MDQPATKSKMPQNKLNWAAILLAAGSSRRFGAENKLFAPWQKGVLLDASLSLLGNLPITQKILVTGFQARRTQELARKYAIPAVYAANHRLGLGASLATGIEAVSPRRDGYAIFLADMPYISTLLCIRLFDHFNRIGQPNAILRPVWRKTPTTPGHPVLFGRGHRSALLKLKTDKDPQDYLRRNKNYLHNIMFDDKHFPGSEISAHSLTDIDKPESIKNLA